MGYETCEREPAPRLAVSVAEAAAALGVSRGGMYRHVQAGTVRSVKIGGRRLVPVAELERLVAAGGGGV